MGANPALTRDPDLVRVAALPHVDVQQINSGLIAFRILHAATKLKADGRDVDAELWRASGMDPPKKLYSLPRAPFCNAKESEIAANELPFEKQLEIRRPIAPSESAGTDVSGEVQGPPHILRRKDFPAEDYLLSCFRVGRLSAIGSLPGQLGWREISREDWAGLRIAIGGDARRLAVWKIGTSTVHGHGDFENVRVGRKAIFELFPVDAPKAILTLDEVLKLAANQAGGTLTQAKAEKIARGAGVYSSRDEVCGALKRLRIQGKQGRTKIRHDPA
jgi:hypothetical protein